jgi:hypothetical protein
MRLKARGTSVVMRLICSSLLCGLALAGCASVSTADGHRLELSSEEFRAYVERVFREQNRVADELAFALEGPTARREGLAAAEQRLLDSCASVNELATARRDEVRLGLRRSLRAARSVPQCEAATREATEALGGTP